MVTNTKLIFRINISEGYIFFLGTYYLYRKKYCISSDIFQSTVANKKFVGLRKGGVLLTTKNNIKINAIGSIALKNIGLDYSCYKRWLS